MKKKHKSIVSYVLALLGILSAISIVIEIAPKPQQDMSLSFDEICTVYDTCFSEYKDESKVNKCFSDKVMHLLKLQFYKDRSLND